LLRGLSISRIFDRDFRIMARSTHRLHRFPTDCPRGRMHPNMLIRRAEPTDAAAIAAVHVASWRTTYPGILAQASIDRLTVADRTVALDRALRGEVAFVPELYVAVASDEVIGFVSGGAIREPLAAFDAELYGIYLLHSAQRTGVGSALTRRLAKRLAELGFRAMVVRVLTANPACRFYERLGGVVVAEGVHSVDGIPYADRTYGYDDLMALARSN
jgi:L-amino acid N-acyltransferase YncA